MPFCAICTDEIVGQPHYDNLGKDDALVTVCADCASSPAVEQRGPERTYEGGGPSMSTRDITAALRKQQGEERYQRDSRFNSRLAQKPTPARPRGEVDADMFRREGADADVAKRGRR